jgi:hypothetical protein
VDTDDTAVLTVDEAAAFLRISRNAAYAAAREWRVTGGRSGLPCISIGRTLRVPRAALDAMLDVSVRPSAPESRSVSARGTQERGVLQNGSSSDGSEAALASGGRGGGHSRPLLT